MPYALDIIKDTFGGMSQQFTQLLYCFLKLPFFFLKVPQTSEENGQKRSFSITKY